MNANFTHCDVAFTFYVCTVIVSSCRDICYGVDMHLR